MSSSSVPKPISANDYGTQIVEDWKNPGKAISEPGGLAGMLTGDPLAFAAQKNFEDMPKPGDPQFAGDTPNPGQSRIDALRAQLAEEQKMRASATLFAGNTAPAKPATAGQLLMGR